MKNGNFIVILLLTTIMVGAPLVASPAAKPEGTTTFEFDAHLWWVLGPSEWEYLPSEDNAKIMYGSAVFLGDVTITPYEFTVDGVIISWEYLDYRGSVFIMKNLINGRMAVKITACLRIYTDTAHNNEWANITSQYAFHYFDVDGTEVKSNFKAVGSDALEGSTVKGVVSSTVINQVYFGLPGYPSHVGTITNWPSDITAWPPSI